MNLQERIEGFLKAADEIVEQYWKEMGFTYAPPPKHEVKYSGKWAKVYQIEKQGPRIYAFIAMEDNTTKALGYIKAGDIHKAATYKVPAKHARGSVFDADYGKSCLNSNGPNYLR